MVYGLFEFIKYLSTGINEHYKCSKSNFITISLNILAVKTTNILYSHCFRRSFNLKTRFMVKYKCLIYFHFKKTLLQLNRTITRIDERSIVYSILNFFRITNKSFVFVGSIKRKIIFNVYRFYFAARS